MYTLQAGRVMCCMRQLQGGAAVMCGDKMRAAAVHRWRAKHSLSARSKSDFLSAAVSMWRFRRQGKNALVVVVSGRFCRGALVPPGESLKPTHVRAEAPDAHREARSAKVGDSPGVPHGSEERKQATPSLRSRRIRGSLLLLLLAPPTPPYSACCCCLPLAALTASSLVTIADRRAPAPLLHGPSSSSRPLL